jgi:hypothetical protein
MKDLQRFGNLINEQDNPIVIRDIEKLAVSQGRKYYRDNIQVYLWDNLIVVARVKYYGGKITRYTILGDRDDYRVLYTNSRDSEDILKQALWHGACILTRRAGNTIGLDYNL